MRILNTAVSAFLLIAQIPDNVSKKADSAAMQYAAQFLAELRSCQIDGQDYTAMEIQEFIPVFSPDDTQNGVLAIIADIDSVGYIQVAEFGGKFYVSEFTDDYDLSFPDEKLYYPGLRSYFRKVKESSFENIITQEICTISDLPARKTASSVHPDPSNHTGIAAYTLSPAMTFIHQPTGNSCAATSAAMVLQYWKEHKGFNDLPFTGTTLANQLISNYIGQGNVGLVDLQNGLTSYVSSLGSHSFSGSFYCSWTPAGYTAPYYNLIDTIRINIVYGRPSIVMVGQMSYPSGGLGSLLHTMPVTGVIYGSTDYLICRDPLFTSANYVNIIWHPANDHPTYFWIYGVCTDIYLY